MIKKIIILAALCLSTTSVMAQEENPFKKFDIGFELGYASALDIGVRFQNHFNKHLTWDMIQVRTAQDYSNTLDANKYLSTWSISTGLRAYTPTFSPGFKAFAAAGLGWGYYHTTDHFISPIFDTSGKNKTHNLAADFSAGLFVWQGVYVSYGCQIFHNNSRGNHIDHLFNIGFELGSFKFKE